MTSQDPTRFDNYPPESDPRASGFETQQRAWEQQYAEAQSRWEAHKKQVEEAEAADVQASVSEANTAAYSSGSAVDDTAPEGSLASDEALQALREKLTGGR